MAQRKPGKQRVDAAAQPGGGATVGHEAELWTMADAVRDAPLPQLVSGELRMWDLERLAGAVT